MSVLGPMSPQWNFQHCCQWHILLTLTTDRLNCSHSESVQLDLLQLSCNSVVHIHVEPCHYIMGALHLLWKNWKYVYMKVTYWFIPEYFTFAIHEILPIRALYAGRVKNAHWVPIYEFYCKLFSIWCHIHDTTPFTAS